MSLERNKKNTYTCVVERYGDGHGKVVQWIIVSS